MPRNQTFFLPSAWLFSLVGTAAVPPVFPAARWHPSQTAPTLTDQNNHGSHKVEKQPSREREKANQNTRDLDKLVPGSSSVPELSPTHTSFLFVLFKYGPFVPPTFPILILFLLCFFLPSVFLSLFLPFCPLPYSGLTLPVQTGMEEFSLRGRKTQRGSKRCGNLREETREGWKKQRSKRNSFIQPVFPPPAPAVEK